MMKRLLVTCVLCLLSVSPTSARATTDRERAGLIGPVRTVSTVTAVHTREGERVLSTYAPNGNEIETALYYSAASGGSLYEHSFHRYDVQGRRIASATYNADEALLKRTVYTYDAQGNLSEKTSTDDAGLIEKTAYTSDENGNPTEEVTYSARGSITVRSVHTYDTQGRVIETRASARAGTFTTLVHTYDAKGNVTARTTYAADGALLDKLLYTYEFDAVGNWITQRELICDPTATSEELACAPAAVIHRTITYEPQVQATHRTEKIE